MCELYIIWLVKQVIYPQICYLKKATFSKEKCVLPELSYFSLFWFLCSTLDVSSIEKHDTSSPPGELAPLSDF